MNSPNVINIIPKEKEKAIRKASETITKLTQTIRAQIAPIFLAEGRNRKLHTRYLQQRKERIWDALEKIAGLLNLHNETPNIRLMLIEGVLQNIFTTRGDVDTIMGKGESSSKAQSLVMQSLITQNKQSKDASLKFLVMSLVHESGISIDGLERFMAATSKKIG